MRRPVEGEFAPYFEHYISLTRGANILQNLEDSTLDLVELLVELPEEKYNYAYEDGKWTILQMLRHVIDVDMVFTYRALNLLRNEGGALPGFDHLLWAENSLKGKLNFQALLNEFKAFRAFAMQFFAGLEGDQWENHGEVSGNNTSVLSIPFIMSGHVLHHAEIIRSRYMD